MANRCPDCSKFVSLDTEDPEEESFDFELNEDGVTVTATLTQLRNCAECGTAMKSYTHELEEVILWETIGVVRDSLDDENKKWWDKMISGDDSPYDCNVESCGTSSDEGGGSRFQKNMISASVDVCITLKGPSGLKIEHDETLTSSVAASDFEDEC